jgi:hypothetical protein
MKRFWTLVGKGLAKGAVWALGHPDEVIKVITVVKR